jgi:hypothetical protein
MCLPPGVLQVYQLPPERLYATYFQGDPKNGIPAGGVALSRADSSINGATIHRVAPYEGWDINVGSGC